jgi:hypothetical protein
MKKSPELLEFMSKMLDAREFQIFKHYVRLDYTDMGDKVIFENRPLVYKVYHTDSEWIGKLGKRIEQYLTLHELMYHAGMLKTA